MQDETRLQTGDLTPDAQYRKPYSPPELVRYGSIAELTMSGQAENCTVEDYESCPAPPP